jgi:hypothetical protein
MRRIAAISLFVLMFAGLILPLLLAHESGGPACCRRTGSHHCAMAPQGDGFRALTSSCPYRRFTALTSHSALLSAVTTALRVDLASENSIALVSPDLSSRAAGNAQKRGPPHS